MRIRLLAWLAAGVLSAAPAVAWAQGIILAAPGGIAVPSLEQLPAAGAQVTLRGHLSYETALEGPHFELVVDGSRYVVVPAPDLDLNAWVGKAVEVEGLPHSGVSIYQMPMLTVRAVRDWTAVQPAPPVTTPVIPDQPAPLPVPLPVPVSPLPPVQVPPVVSPVPVGPITIQPMPPAEAPAGRPPVAPDKGKVNVLPVPFHQTQLFLLFGQVELTAGASVYQVGGVAVWDPDGLLQGLVGQRAVVVAQAASDLPAGARFRAVHALSLQGDLAGVIGSGSVGVYTDPGAPIRVLVRGRPVQFDAPPVVGNDRALVPIRAISEALGATVSWDPATQTVTVSRDNRTVTLVVGSTTVRVRMEGPDGFAEELTFDIAPVIIRGRLVVPVRVLSQALGWQVGWDQATRTVSVDP